jgi:hypothetical protein
MSKRRLRRWIKWLLMATALFAVINFSLSRLLASRRAHGLLTARLAQQFGRNVEVGRFDLQWLPSPGIVANQVTVADDPRYGNEYFLRADSVVASPRWGALIAGRLEIGTLQLSQPSLNLVRNPDGKWNVESWLPPVPATGASAVFTGPRAPRASAKLFRIVIDGGRINFNQGVDRRPFALVDLAGSIERESPGVWNVALTARPQRATVHLQNSGLLRLAGHIAGTSARLHPAELALTWSDASLADALRLAMGRDPGVRGEFQLQLTAKTLQTSTEAMPIPAQWSFSFSAHVDGLHRWDMPSRGDNPALNIQAEAAWKAGAPNVELSKLLVQAPRSNIEGTGSVNWSHGFEPELKLSSSGVAFDDLLGWYRSFQPGVAEGLSANGFLTGETGLRGWPVRVDSASVKSFHTTLSNGNTPLLELVNLEGFAKQGSGSVGAGIWFPPGEAPTGFLAGTPNKLLSIIPQEWLSVSASFAKQGRDEIGTNKFTGMHFRLDLNAAMEHGERLIAASRALGRPLNNNWDAKGGVDGHLQWQWSAGEKFPRAIGEITTQAVSLQLPVFNQPLEFAKAKVELKAGERRVTIADASGLGAHWEGTISRREAPIPMARARKATGAASTNVEDVPGDWEFDLAADKLDAAELDRWMGPRSRPGWLARFFTQAGNTPSQILISGPLGQLHARGSLQVETFTLAPLDFQKLHAQLELVGRYLDVSQFDAKAYGGSIAGKLKASLGGDPAYSVDATVSNVSATELAAANSALEGRVAGHLSGDFSISMHGIGRDNLLDSLVADGRVSATQAIIRGMNFSNAGAESSPEDGQAPFSLVNADFSVAARQFKFQRIAVQAGKEFLEGNGTADFGRALHFDFGQRQSGLGITKVNERFTDRVTRVTGLLEAPQVGSVTLPAGTAQPAQRPTTQSISQSTPRETHPTTVKTASSPGSKNAPAQSTRPASPQPAAHLARH